ncbi:STM4013/SEN3800 family hydrolase [Verrucomicrobiota bacterium sgz303538]
MSIDMNQLVGSHDIVFLTLDTLRFDIAQSCFQKGQIPELAHWFPNGWEQRHSPGSFTYAAHHAFFAGFLPTPASPPWPKRLFAARFAGSETTGQTTWVFDAPDIVHALRERGYHTICIGGVGFFNKLSPLSSVLPGLFDESHWSPELGVTNRDSTRLQFELAARRLRELPREKRAFLFINISAIHQPNRHYLPDAAQDSLDSHAAALRYVDSQVPILREAIEERGSALLIVCSDHGTLYGEEGFTGHRVGHSAVWTVPYADAILPAS